MFHDDRIADMFVQVIRILRHPIFHRAGNADVVDNTGVLNIFTKPDPASMRTHWNVEPCGKKHDGHDFVHAAQTTTIKLTNL